MLKKSNNIREASDSGSFARHVHSRSTTRTQQASYLCVLNAALTHHACLHLAHRVELEFLLAVVEALENTVRLCLARQDAEPGQVALEEVTQFLGAIC